MREMQGVFSQYEIRSTVKCHGFRMCEFASLPKLIDNPYVSTCGAVTVVLGHFQSNRKFQLPNEDNEGDTLPSYFNFSYYK